MITKDLITEVLEQSLTTGGDFSELYIEYKNKLTMKLIGGAIEESLSGTDYGIGLRIIHGLNSIYAYTNKNDRDSLLALATEASQAITKKKKDFQIDLRETLVKNNNVIEKNPKTIDSEEKIHLMKLAYQEAKEYDELISQVKVNYMDQHKKITIANSEGLYKTDEQTFTSLNIQSIAKKENEMQVGRTKIAAYQGFELYHDQEVIEKAREASEIAKKMLLADPCPSGKMPVIIDNGFGGVIFHEACGHGLEATSVAKGNSVFADKVGQRVASELVTAIDDGTRSNLWGSINVDDEGTPPQKNVLIEKGILKGFMVDRLNGKRMNQPSTGSARRQSYQYPPTSRMTNTYIAPGESTKQEIIEATDYGLYAKKMGGGSVNPATGEFNFAVMEGYIVKDGKIIKPVRGASLIGKGIDVLKKIDKVGNNLAFGQGMCGSISGSVPVTVGQPTIRVKEMTVGGVK